MINTQFGFADNIKTNVLKTVLFILSFTAPTSERNLQENTGGRDYSATDIFGKIAGMLNTTLITESEELKFI